MTDALDKMTAPTIDDALLGEDGMPRQKAEDPESRYRRLSKDTRWVSAKEGGDDPHKIANLRKYAPHEVADHLVRNCGHCDEPIGKVYRLLNGAVLCSDACWEAEVRREPTDEATP